MLIATGFAGTRWRLFGTTRRVVFVPCRIPVAPFTGLAALTFARIARIVITWQSSWLTLSVLCLAGIGERFP